MNLKKKLALILLITVYITPSQAAKAPKKTLLQHIEQALSDVEACKKYRVSSWQSHRKLLALLVKLIRKEKSSPYKANLLLCKMLNSLKQSNDIPSWINNRLLRSKIGRKIIIHLSLLVSKNKRKKLLRALAENLATYAQKDLGTKWIAKLIAYIKILTKTLENHGESQADYTECLLPLVTAPLTQTQQHLIKNGNLLSSDNFAWGGWTNLDIKHDIKEKILNDIINNVIDFERDYPLDQYHTFLHGQRWQNYIVEDWFTRLWSLKNNQDLDDFIFPHVRNLSLSEDELADEKEVRRHLVKNGFSNNDDCWNATHDRTGSGKFLWFMNYALFAGSRQGACPFSYARHSVNIGAPRVCLRDAFICNGYEKHYDKYEDKLESLEHRFNLANEYGNILAVAIPRTILEKCTYTAEPGGYKKDFYISAGYDDSGQPLTYSPEIAEVMQDLSGNSIAIETDAIEFCLTMTADIIDPISGIKIRAIHQETKELKALKKEAQKLFEQIATEIQNDKLCIVL